jgi:hypothetical protein
MQARKQRPVIGHVRRGDMANLLKLILGALPDATNAAEEMARYILGLRAAGKADEVTEAMMAAADDSYMYANTPLDMSQEARMARADEMFPREGFHGTNADIDAFQGNVFSTDNPTLASTYARGGMTDAQIYPLRLGSKLGDTVVEGGGANWNQLDVDEIYKNDPAVAGWLGYDEIADGSGKASTRGVERAAMYEGRSGVQFKDINDIGPGFNSNQFKNLGYTKEQELAFKQQYMEDLSKPSNIDVRLSPNLVRSKFARFDPEFRNLRNLSASLFATLGFSGLAEGLRDKGILPTEGESVMANLLKAAIDLGKPVVKAVGEAFDALGNKIGALPDVDVMPPNRSFSEGYEGNSVLPKMFNSSDELVDPDYVYRTMSKKEYNEVLNRGELVNTNGRTHASASPLSEFSNNVDDTVTVRIKYDKGDGWKAKSGLDEIYAVTDQPISSDKIELFGALPNPVLKTDNPGGDWLADKIRYAEEDRLKYPQDTYASNLGNSAGVTGWISEPIMLNPNLLANFKGAMGEEKIRASSPKLKNLQDNIASEGYKPDTILIHVREDGVPFIIEGNHRVAEAVASNRGSIPVEIKYLRGAENVDGPLNPTLLGAKK